QYSPTGSVFDFSYAACCCSNSRSALRARLTLDCSCLQTRGKSATAASMATRLLYTDGLSAEHAAKICTAIGQLNANDRTESQELQRHSRFLLSPRKPFAWDPSNG